MNYFKISLGIFIALAASRFIPHPPNFTSLIALGFYVPALLGARYLPALLVSFVITDLIIGFHTTIFFTWGSILIIGLISKYLNNNFVNRLSGALLGACLFFLITNFGVWIGGTYGYSFQGLIASYVLGLPFFGYTFLSTIIFAAIIEMVYKFSKLKYKKKFL